MSENNIIEKRKDADYGLMLQQLECLCKDVPTPISNLANASALLWSSMNCLNWAGFYLMSDGVLYLGPFQGKVACTRIEIGKGVCGTAVAEDATQVVADVTKHPNHIACDAASRSEIVVPIHKNGEIYGVLDMDSPITERFNEEDRAGLEAFVSTLEKYI